MELCIKDTVMRYKLKALCVAMAISVLSFSVVGTALAENIPVNPLLEQLEKKADKPPATMQTKRWNTPTYGKDGKEKEADQEIDNDDQATIDEDDIDSIDEADLTEEQKIWKKYRDLAKSNKPADTDKDKASKDEPKEADEQTQASADDIQPTNTNDEAIEEEVKKELTGIAAILDRYKNSQKGKGKMNTRSFGSIE
tara:strand:+ start:78 stop:668 length:591 start_codon:yes stop_codon:yes gene_type:complete